MKLFSKVALATATVSIASFASAASISGSTDFRVTLPEILVLYHWDDAHLILTDVTTTPGNDSDAREISDNTTRDLTAGLSAGDNTYLINTAVNSNEPTGTTVLGDKISVTLKDSWAVRSLSSGDVTLALDNTGERNTLINQFNADSKIITEEAKLVSTSSNEGEGTTLTIPSGWTAVSGDINFKLNLASANNSGQYNTRGSAVKATDSAADNDKDTFLLTLTGHTPAIAP